MRASPRGEVPLARTPAAAAPPVAVGPRSPLQADAAVLLPFV